LLAELDRYFGGYSVDAVEPTVSYRAGKFIRRHKVGAGPCLRWSRRLE